MKNCSKCKEDRPKELFYKAKGYKDGLSSWCRTCTKSYNAERYVHKKDHIATINAEWVKNNPEKKAAINRSSAKRNRVRRNDQSKSYRKVHKGRVNADNALRRANLKNASPPWLSAEHKEGIKQLYKLAQKFEKTFGLKYHVDHIVPLNGDNVCGLHVPWNLQILESKMNLKKSNKTGFQIKVYYGTT